jgi:hypothetical protein
MVKGRTPALGAIGSRHGSLEFWPEQLEVDGPTQALQRIALLRQIGKAYLRRRKNPI